jgi:hypothetical protein
MPLWWGGHFEIGSDSLNAGRMWQHNVYFTAASKQSSDQLQFQARW